MDVSNESWDFDSIVQRKFVEERKKKKKKKKRKKNEKKNSNRCLSIDGPSFYRGITASDRSVIIVRAIRASGDCGRRAETASERASEQAS
jgi:hypothetical protein